MEILDAQLLGALGFLGCHVEIFDGRFVPGKLIVLLIGIALDRYNYVLCSFPRVVRQFFCR